MILTEEKIQKYIPSSILNDYSVLEMQESISMGDYLKPLLGSTLITRLLKTEDDTDRDALMPYFERPLAYFTYLDCVDTMDLVHTAQGFVVMSNANMTPASKDRVLKFKNSIADKAYSGVEALLEFIEENIGKYPEWKESDTYLTAQDHFIDTAIDFHKYVRISKNRRTFLALIPHMGDIETFRIKSVLKDKYDSLLNATATETETKILLPLIKGAIANLSMAKALDLLTLDIGDDGIYLKYDIGKNKPADTPRIEQQKRSFMTDGERYLALLIEEYDKLFPDTLREAPYENEISPIFVM